MGQTESILLAKESPRLQTGECQAKVHRQRYREIGLVNLWVALFEEMPIATGTTQAEVEQIVRKILPKAQQAFIHIFQVKGK